MWPWKIYISLPHRFKSGYLSQTLCLNIEYYHSNFEQTLIYFRILPNLSRVMMYPSYKDTYITHLFIILSLPVFTHSSKDSTHQRKWKKWKKARVSHCLGGKKARTQMSKRIDSLKNKATYLVSLFGSERLRNFCLN